MGVSTSGANVHELPVERAEQAQPVQRDAAAAGPLRIVREAVPRRSKRDVDTFSARDFDARLGAVEFAAPIRELDRVDSSCRD